PAPRAEDQFRGRLFRIDPIQTRALIGGRIPLGKGPSSVNRPKGTVRFVKRVVGPGQSEGLPVLLLRIEAPDVLATHVDASVPENGPAISVQAVELRGRIRPDKQFGLKIVRIDFPESGPVEFRK